MDPVATYAVPQLSGLDEKKDLEELQFEFRTSGEVYQTVSCRQGWEGACEYFFSAYFVVCSHWFIELPCAALLGTVDQVSAGAARKRRLPQLQQTHKNPTPPAR